MPTLTCPTCRATMTVSDAAPARLTCPRCLAAIENPSALQPRQVLPIMPLEHEARLDRRSADAGITVLACLLAIGAFTLFLVGYRALGFVSLIAIVAIGVAVVLPRRRQPRQISLETMPTLACEEQRRILAYQGPSITHAKAGSGLFVLGLIGGPFAMITMCAFGGPLGVAMLAAGIVLASLPPTRALGAGILVGIGLILLVLVSICGGGLALSAVHQPVGGLRHL